jgi:hypothetical protein
VFQAIGRMRRPRPEGAYIYYATLALAAGQDEMADRALGAMTSEQPVLRELREVVAAQRDAQPGRAAGAIRRLEPQWQKFSAFTKPLALYWLGRAYLASEDATDQQRGVLYLLRIPASHGAAQPEVAGAALFQAQQALSAQSDALGANALRNELLERYGQTYFAARAQSSDRPPEPLEE